MVAILLVHGTFAVDAPWTEEDSFLRRRIDQAVSEKGHSVEFLPIAWSGKNWFADRLEASQRIHSTVARLRQEQSEEKIFIIGHSHGGSAAAYFLQKSKNDPVSVDGCIFLSTPFLALKIKPGLTQRVKTFFYVLWLGLQISSLMAATALGSLSPTLGLYLSFGANVLLGAVLIQAYRSYWFFHRLIEKTKINSAAIIKARDSCNLPDHDYLFLRFSGDEASFGLSFVQTISYGLNRGIEGVYQSLSRLIGIGTKSRIGGELRELVAVLLIGSWLSFSPVLVNYNLSLDQVTQMAEAKKLAAVEQTKKEIEAQTSFLRFIEDQNPCAGYDPSGHEQDPYGRNSHRCTDDAIREAEQVVIPLEHALTNNEKYLSQIDFSGEELLKFRLVRLLDGILKGCLYLLFGLATVGSLVILCLRAFGYVGLTELLYIEASVEPVPHGSHKILHLDWSVLSSGTNLRHSQVHSSPAAVDAISSWIAKQI